MATVRIRCRPGLPTLMAVVVGSGVALAGCASAARPPLPPPPTGVVTVTQLPDEPVDFGNVCTGEVFPSAPAFAGPPPHPIDVFVDGRQEPQSGWPDITARNVQIVACVDNDGQVSGETSPVCHYGIGGENADPKLDATMNLWWYRITVYEVRTHRVLGRDRIIGRDTRCPDIRPAGADPGLTSVPSADQLHAELDRYVESP
jgi:hypothetical protein